MIPDDLKMKKTLAFFSEDESTIGFISSDAMRSQLLFRMLRVSGMDGMNEIIGKW
jgi:hypothetical protein